MTLINTNLVASRLLKREKALASGCCPSLKNAAELCMWQRKRHAFRPTRLNFPGETEFFLEFFCLEYLSRRSEKEDGHFANCRFSFLLIFISFCSISFRKLQEAQVNPDPGTYVVLFVI